MKKYSKHLLSLAFCTLMLLTQFYTLGGEMVKVAAATEPIVFPTTQDAFVSNFGSQAESVGINLNSNKLIYGKNRHTYLKFDLTSIDTQYYDINQIKVELTFRKSHAPNDLIFTESDSTLMNSVEEWTASNLTYNNRPNDVAESPLVTQNVTSNGEETITVDLSPVFQFAFRNDRKVVTIHISTDKVNDGTVAASEMYSSRNDLGQAVPTLSITLGNPIINDNVDKTALDTLIIEADKLLQADYTPESWNNFIFTLNQSKVVNMTNTSAESVNKALLALQTAMNNLVKIQKPSQLAGPDMGDYFTNSANAAKIFKMKNVDDQYIKVDPVTEKLSLTSNSGEASTFALYVLDYFKNVEKEEPEAGATRTAYSIKSLDTGKYLSIQNYFTAEEFLSDTHQYFNIISGDADGFSTDRIFEIKASASMAGWNERFYVDQYGDADYYRIWSHLSRMRDSADFDRFNVKMTADSMQSSGIEQENTEYRFVFEEATKQNLLEINQKVSGYDAELSWFPINGDTNPDNYKLDGEEANVRYTEGMMRAELVDLSVGVHKYNVEHNEGEYQTSTAVDVRIFDHPGILLTMGDLDRMKAHVEAKEEPWYSDYQRLVNSVPYNLSSPSYVTTVFSNVGRGGAPSDSGNIGYFEKGGLAAYFNALQWVITGEDQYAEKTVEILNKWADGLKVLDGRDRILGAGINAYKYASAAEIVRYYNGGYSQYSDEDFNNLKGMMINVIYPVIQDAAVPMYANGNWDAAAMVSLMAIGVLCENTEIFNRGMTFYQDIHTNGSIFAYVNESGQTMETGRDQGHAMLGLGYMAEISMIAKNQNEDLYSLYDNRLAKAFEYTAKYNLYSKELYGEDSPFVAMPNVFGDTARGYYGAGFDNDKNGLNRGELRPVFEQALALYNQVENLDLTWTKRAADASRPQALVHIDNMNFGTLTYYKGEALGVSSPYFQMRTRWEPLYQRNWSTVDGEKVAETLNSYYDVDDNGELVTSVMKKDAPFYQLVPNEDGTYSIRFINTNTYLSVKDELVGGNNIIKADATAIGDSEKFTFRSTGVGPYFLASPKYDNRIVYQEAEGSGNNATLKLMLGSKQLSQIKDIPDVTTNERLIFMFNNIEEYTNDVTPPATTDNVSAGWINQDVVVSLNTTDESSGVATTYYIVNDGPEKTGTEVKLTEEGTNKLVYWSVDKAGNVEGQKTATVKIDKTAPEIAIPGFENENLSYAIDTVLDVTFKDILSGVNDSETHLYIDGETYINGDILQLYALPLGVHTLNVEVSDLAGNFTNDTVTFSTLASTERLKQMVTSFEKRNLIDNQGVANSLRQKLSSNNLQSFINEVQAQGEKHIGNDAAEYMLRDANALIGNN
ncbi:OmpL47-type beta-barrel domain-containing protein [Trichococcus collinsii]|uniref:Alginate lyase n=1 Tax=Trichococcus collinsii TaxID=157076 RepID=A0AB38A4F7_9LACT|nr:alginate lyase family protein [Trichococcus collinsii]CZQ99237.1 alginate lyase [Trichococcus collinsii]SEA92939.1 Alginate lyase [Trichococcus collinsii]